MGSKLFYELDRAAGSARTDVHNGTVSTEDVSYSLVFDKQRNSVWAQGIEYGIPGVESNNYQEDTTFLNTVIDDGVTDRPVQVFKGYGNVEYSLYVNPNGNLCIYGFVPIDVTSLQSGKRNDSRFVQTNKLSVEIGTTVATDLTHIRLLTNGSSVPINGTTDNSSVKRLKIDITGNLTVSKDFTRTNNATFLNGIRETNVWSFSDLGITIPSGNSDLGKTLGSTSLALQIWDVKNNTDTASIAMVEVYDKCYYFHDVAWTNVTSLTYSQMTAKTGFYEWKTGTLGPTTISSNGVNTADKYLYILVPNRKSISVYSNNMPTAVGLKQTIQLTNQSGAIATYKVYKTGELHWGGATNIKIVI
jgi:hypothetical protein